jgi:hypothetical protein
MLLTQLPFAIREKIIRLAIVECLEKTPEITCSASLPLLLAAPPVC